MGVYSGFQMEREIEIKDMCEDFDGLMSIRLADTLPKLGRWKLRPNERGAETCPEKRSNKKLL